MARTPRSGAGRIARLGALTGGVATRALKGKLRGALGGDQAKADEAMLQNAGRIAESLGQLKGAAMKVGQSIALMADSLDLPDEVRGQLSRLHSEAEPVPFEQIRSAVELSLEGSLAQRFARFDETPIGTASLAQAHCAALPDGTEVVVKVLHPGIEKTVGVDVAALRTLLLGTPGLRRRRKELQAALDGLQRRLEEELDYDHEAMNLQTFQRMYAEDPDIVVPRVHPAWSTERVLTLDLLKGLRLEHFLKRAGPPQRSRAAHTLARLLLESLFVHRALHADPHPGNYLFSSDGQVQLLDFGCVQRFDEFWLAGYASIILSTLDGDDAGILQGCRDAGIWQGDDPKARVLILEFCKAMLAPFTAGPFRVGGPQDQLLESARRVAPKFWLYPEVQGPPQLVFLHRTVAGIYAMLRRLDAEQDWEGMLRKYAGHAVQVARGG